MHVVHVAARSLAMEAILVGVACDAVGAQGTESSGCSAGSFVECSRITRHEGDGRLRQDWLVAIVLWRRIPYAGVSGADTSGRRAVIHAYQITQRAMEDSNRYSLGGMTSDLMGVRWWSASYSRPASPDGLDTLFAAGQAFVLPRRDSALVVMVDHFGGRQPPTVVRTAWIPASMPDGYWAKTWVSGDTTFRVMPRLDSVLLQDALMRVPSISEFLR